MNKSFTSLNTNVIFVDNYNQLSQKISSYGSNFLFVVDENTSKMVRPLPEPNVILKSGENYKNFRSIVKILKQAADHHLSRETIFIAFGGGVVCDLTAFASSVFMRGAKLTLIPTTLLSMVDASLGGKTGFDFNDSKNLIGSFYPADEVIICPDTLISLSDQEFKNGLAEVLKHALLSKDDKLYLTLVNNKEKIFQRDIETLNELIYLSLQVKNDFISKDPKETKNIRQALNLGHTFGHALETHTHFSAWSHGEAVAWGVGRAIETGVKLGITTPEFAYGVNKLFRYFNFDFNYRLDRSEWQDYQIQLLKDKKRNNQLINFVLLKGQGDFVLQNVDFELIKDVVLKKALY